MANIRSLSVLFIILFLCGCLPYKLDDTSICVEGETENLAQLWHPDNDHDGYGQEDSPVWSCTQPEGYVVDGTDCNDSDATVYTGAPELCDGKDNNCDGIIDDDTAFIDEDGDGISFCIDCDDQNPTVGGPTIWYEDTDNDSYGQGYNGVESCTQPGEDFVSGEADCSDSDATVYPGAPELCDVRWTPSSRQHVDKLKTQLQSDLYVRSD